MATYTMFTYAGVGIPTIAANCTVYIGVDALLNDTLSLSLNINGSPAGPFNNAAHVGPGANIHEAGLYYTSHQNLVSLSAPRDYLYEAIDNQDGSVVGSMTLTWVPAAPPCPDPAPDASPPPVLTAIPASGGIQLDWTSSHSADLHFKTIRYDVYKSTSGGSFVKITNYPNELFDWYTLLDTATVVGTSYRYYVKGVEPIIGQGGDSNIVTLTWTPPPATSRASWGVLAA